MKVDIIGTDWNLGRIQCRDDFGNEFEVDGLLRPKGRGFPAVGERWRLVKKQGVWVPSVQIGAPPVAVIDGDRDGMHPVEEQMLDAMVRHGLVVDSTDGRGD